MSIRKILATASAASLLGLAAVGAAGAETIKVGLVAPFSGPFAQYGGQMYAGIKAYFHLHGDEVAGKKIEIIRRDTGGSGPEIARRLSQELVNRDKVDFLAGYGLTPEAMASAPIAERSKTPMIVMNAATQSIVEKSQYVARVSLTTGQGSGVIGHWAAGEGIKTAVTLVADYGPGLDAEAAFKSTFTRGGGKIIESIRTPLNSPDFSPYMQKIKDLGPDAVFVFVPAGEQSIGFMKNYQSRGLADVGIKVIGTGDVTDDHVLPAMGDEALGVITGFHYSVAHKSPENEKFLKAFAEVNPDSGQANFMTVAGYDGMDAIFQVARALDGNIDGDKAMEVLKGMKINSPRGPLVIDPETRDVVQTEYVRRVERIDGQLHNVEFARFPQVKGDGDVSGEPLAM